MPHLNLSKFGVSDEHRVDLCLIMCGKLPPGMGTSGRNRCECSSRDRLFFNFQAMSCVMLKPITSIQSPSLTIQIHPGNSCSESFPTASFEPNRARVSVRADSLLERDLVVIVQSAGYDQQHALVKCHLNDATHAISLTCSPRFALNLLRASEPIFLVGQSGSMCGTIIKQARDALELFLRFIPFENHYFNVTGFGPEHKAVCLRDMEQIIRRRVNHFVCEGLPSGHRIVGFASPDRVFGKGRGLQGPGAGMLS